MLIRLTNFEQRIDEQNAMLKSVITSLSRTDDDEEDVLAEPLDTEEGLAALDEKLCN